MADNNNKNNKTIFQKLASSMIYGFNKDVETQIKTINNYTLNPNDVILKTNNKDEIEKASTQMKQSAYLSKQWVRAGFNLGQTNSIVSSNLKMMYRDCDIMDAYPEIGSALDTFSEEANCLNNKGNIINIFSNSKRVKTVLDDLFINRLDIHINLPMWTRTMCKYGNAYALLNITDKNGIIGARQLPVYEIERIENGQISQYTPMVNPSQNSELKDSEFVWIGKNTAMPFKNWQIAHFRLLNDSIYLPYGVSILNKARRHFRILTMMEDMMLINNLERGIDRRLFKIFVGNIDDADIPAYLNEMANSVKRTPVVDPETGQLDLKKCSIAVDTDLFVATRDKNDPSPIEMIPASANLDKIEPLKFIQNKLLAGLRVPKAFIGFEESAGEGRNLALRDIRFSRVINRIQQALIMELNKIAIIHLYLLGYEDELNNFKITMNSPSTQSEILHLEELGKKIELVRNSVQDPGNGIPVMSMTRAQREILGWSDDEINQNMMEIRMEKALAAELEKTSQIIKRTGLFDSVDEIYGDVNAEYMDVEGGGEMGGEGPSGGGGGGFGGGIDLGGELPEGGEGEIPSEEGNEELPQDNEPKNENQPMESVKKSIDKLLVEKNKQLIKTDKRRKNVYLNAYSKYLNEAKNNEKDMLENIIPISDKSFMINEETVRLIKFLDEKTNIE